MDNDKYDVNDDIDLQCRICMCTLTDCVLASDEYSYHRICIETYFRKCSKNNDIPKSMVSNLPLKNTYLINNITASNIMNDYLEILKELEYLENNKYEDHYVEKYNKKLNERFFNFQCKICFEPMFEASIAYDGHSYHTYCIEVLFQSYKYPISPITNNVFEHKIIINNILYNNIVKCCIFNTDLFDNYFSSISIKTISNFNLNDIIFNNKKLQNLINYDTKSLMMLLQTEKLFEMIHNKNELSFKNDQIIINYRNEEGNTLLLLACLYKLPKCALKLLDNMDIDVNYANINKENKTALIMSCENGLSFVDVTMKLLDQYDIFVNCKTSDGKTPFSIACEHKLSNIALKLLDNKNIDLNFIDANGNNLFMIACENELEDVALKLFNKLYSFENNINYTNMIGKTSLTIAFEHKLWNIVRMLLECKDIKIMFNNEFECKYLLAACYNKIEDIAMKLLEFKNVHHSFAICDNNNCTPLIFACSNKLNIIAIKILSFDINKNKNENENENENQDNIIIDVNHKTKFGNTALILACKHNLCDVIEQLLTFSNIDINIKNIKNMKAIHYAYKNKSDHIINLLKAKEKSCLIL
jgi:ankyrin repeat protein